MPETRATIVIEARDQASQEFKDLTNAVTGLTGAIKEQGTTTAKSGEKSKQASFDIKDLAAGFYLAKNAAAMVQGAIQQLTGETVAYAEQVRDLSRVSGASVEETSKMIQVADDAKVNTGTLTFAFRQLIRQGIQPNIENLSKLSDEYRGMTDPVKRSQFALEKFGRAGLEMTKVLELGGEEMKASAAEAERLGLVMSGPAVKAARDYEKAMDNLDDAAMGFKITVGNMVLPAITKLAQQMNDGIATQSELSEAVRDGTITAAEYNQALGRTAGGAGNAAKVLAELRVRIRDETAARNAQAAALTNWVDEGDRAIAVTAALAGGLPEVTDGLIAQQIAAQDLALALAGPLGNEIEAFTGKQGELLEKQQALSAEIEKYTALNGAAIPPAQNLAEIQDKQTLAAADYEAALKTLNDAQGSLIINQEQGYGLEVVLNQKYAEAKVALNEKKTALEEAIKAVGDASGGTANYSTKLGELQTELGNVNKDIGANAAKHEEATRRILFGLLQQRVSMALTAGTITEEQMPAINKSLNNVALNWGLLDQGTKTAIDSIDLAIVGLRNGSIAGFENDLYDIAGPTIRDTVIPAADDLAAKFGEVADDALYGNLIPAVEELDGALGMEHSLAKTITQDTIPAFKGLIEIMKGELAIQMGKLYIDTVALEGAWSNLGKAVRDAIGAMSGLPSHLPPYADYIGGGASAPTSDGGQPVSRTPTPASRTPASRTPASRTSPIAQAHGGDWWVTSPTLFLAGEAGPERATFTPMSQSGGSTIIHNIVTLDGRVVFENIMKEAKARGLQLASVM